MGKSDVYVLSIVGVVAIIGVVVIIMASMNIPTSQLNVKSGTSNSLGQAFGATNIVSQTSNGYFCSDSDGGVDYSIKGTTYGYAVSSKDNYSFEDKCLGNGVTLIEYSCLSNNVYSEVHTCPGQCVDGRCE